MQNISKRKSWKFSPSFALISVLALVSLAALTATAFLASARLERQATSSLGNATRLEMALNSGKSAPHKSLTTTPNPTSVAIPTLSPTGEGVAQTTGRMNWATPSSARSKRAVAASKVRFGTTFPSSAQLGSPI